MMNEHEHQCALFDWAKLNETATPELALLYATPMGGKRPIKTAIRMKKEGAKAGIPDITLPVPVDRYHGLYIELKVGKNKPTSAQQWWHDKLREQGYGVYVAYGWEDARDTILEYLAGWL